MAEPRSLSDEELLGREFTTADPGSIEGLSTDPPSVDQPLLFLMEYHLGADEAQVRCCACERKTEHSNGFVVEAGSHRHLIGSSCGPKHFGLKFGQGRSELKSAVKRQRQLRRALALKKRREALLNYSPSVATLNAIVAVQDELKGQAPKLYRELKRLVDRGEPFSTVEKQRDFERERRTGSDGPLYEYVRASLGQVRGRGLLSAQTLSRAFEERRRSLAVLFNALGGNTNDVEDRKLGALLDAVEAANTKAATAAAALNSAGEFFAPDNLHRLQTWAATVKVETFKVEDGRIGFPQEYYRDVHWVSAPPAAALPPPPPLFT